MHCVTGTGGNAHSASMTCSTRGQAVVVVRHRQCAQHLEFLVKKWCSCVPGAFLYMQLCTYGRLGASDMSAGGRTARMCPFRDCVLRSSMC